MIKTIKQNMTLFALFLLSIMATTSYAAFDVGTQTATLENGIYQSGYLEPEVYAKLAEVKLPSGRITHRWVSPLVIKESYHAALVKDVVFYPKMEPNPQVSVETLKEVQAYLTQALKDRLAKRIEIVDQAGSGVMEVQLAITGVIVKTEGMKAYEVVPVAAVFGALKAVTGNRNKEIAIQVEIKIVDSETRDLLIAVVRDFKGEDVVDPDKKLQLEDFKANLDQLVQDGEQSVDQVIK